MKFIALLLGATLAGVPLRAAETAVAPGREATRALAYQQERVREKFAELERKMGELAELLKEKEPAAAAKLTAALKTAREDLVVANMQAVAQALLEARLPEAAEQSQKLVEELRKLLALLSESERSLDSLQKELDRLQNQLAALRELIRQETTLQAQSEQLARLQAEWAELKKESEDPKRSLATLEKRRKELEEQLAQAKFEDMKQAQQATRSQAESLSGALQQTQKENSPSSQPFAEDSRKQVSAAAEDMKKAEQNLRDREAGKASENQLGALDKLKSAEQKLQEAVSAAQTQQLAQMEQVLRQMLERQKTISADTIRLDQKPAAARGREEELKQKELSDGETGLAQQAAQLVAQLKKEGSTSIFPVVLDQTRADLAAVAERIATGDTGRDTQKRQAQIEANLAELTDALQKERVRRQVLVAGGGGGGGGPGALVPQVAELKMLKRLQLRVNDRTVELDAARKNGGSLTKEQEAELRELTQRQAEVEKMTRALAHKLKGGCSQCGHQH